MLNHLISKYKKEGVILDTNLLLLYLIGSYDVDYICQFKRTCMYDVNDFRWLRNFIHNFDSVIVTPQVLGELWNFVEKIRKDRFSRFLDVTIPRLIGLCEHYIEKELIIEETCFRYVGVTDTSLICSGKQRKCLVITDDLRSYSYYLSNGVEAININHLRVI